MKTIIKNLVSFLLPFTVLILIPHWIEKNITIQYFMTFVVGVIIIIFGLYIMIQTISTFIRIGRGTLAPWSPTRKLITGGMYGYVRNPMILGVLTVLLGESIAILSSNIFIWAMTYFVIMNAVFFIYEEPDLERKFGEEYRDYKKNVPRWVPRLRPYTTDSAIK